MSSSNHTVEYMAEKIAPFIDKSWPSDAEDIFSNLTYVQEEIWESGKFHGSSQWFYCKVYPDGTLKTPHGYNVLLGLDINAKPVTIRDQSFLFHKNGPGDIKSYLSRNKLIRDVYDLGESPVLWQPTDVDNCKCRNMDCNPKWIYVKSVACESSEPAPFCQISGEDGNSNIIYTYEKTDENGNSELCSCSSPEELDGIKVIDGVRYPIKSERTTFKNIKFSRITNIVKEPTRTAVEFWAVDEHGSGFLVARMEPYQVLSRYKNYRIPPSCSRLKCVLGLFKRSAPDPILSEKQLFICSNLSAVTALAIAVDYKFVKKDIQAAVPYIQAAAIHLNSEIRESSSNSVSPIQVDEMTGYQKFPKF